MEKLMEKHDELLLSAKKSLNAADHLTYMTYPLVKDVKIVLTITQNLHSCVMDGMEAVLQFDRYYKRINPLTDNFENKFSVFKEKCASRYNFNIDDLELIQEIKTILNCHKESNMEFIRSNKVIMCSPTFKMKTFDIPSIKLYLARTKKFIAKVDMAIRC
ncbi:MAG: hypothetical protein PHF86_13780 [Candidatus Nanoarchaeia archaeon]|nr:hypothetical protein [Candidatus Nanoarchaeia archaeon]